MPLERLESHSSTGTCVPLLPRALLLGPRKSGESEIIPDSEEERLNSKLDPGRAIEVINVSSDDSEVEKDNAPPVPERTPVARRKVAEKSASRLYFSRRRIIESSDEENEEIKVIEISDSEVEFVHTPIVKKSTNPKLSVVPTSQDGESEIPIWPVVDESIMIFDEPRGSRKPLHLPTAIKEKDLNTSEEPKTPRKTHNLATRILINNTLGLSDNASESSTSVARPKAPARTPRANSKKAIEAADLQRRENYAQQLFTELNNIVFGGALPPDTRLRWSKRLLSTAGKAKFHRTKEGLQTIEIELAAKILDCEERIRNTLSHEMCHLATWIIDNNMQEQHGKLFKSWAALVQKKRPDIKVSIRHNYDITHPFEWKCEKCSKIYGRFSNSINPNECVCGDCKEGKLIPQFTSKRKPDAPKLSHMAAAKPKDSPSAKPRSIVIEANSDSDDGLLERLAQTIASTSLA